MNNDLTRLNSCIWFSEQTKALASQLLFSLQVQQRRTVSIITWCGRYSL